MEKLNEIEEESIFPKEQERLLTEKEHPYRERNKGIIILLITTVIWSLAFIAQSTAMDQDWSLRLCVLSALFYPDFAYLPFAFFKAML